MSDRQLEYCDEVVRDNYSRLNKLEIELSALKEKVNFFSVIYGKFDTTIGKMQEMIEDRRYENNEEVKDIYERLEDSENRILNEIKSIRNEMQEMNKVTTEKLNQFDRWRWLVIGGGMVVGFLLSKAITFVNLG